MPFLYLEQMSDDHWIRDNDKSLGAKCELINATAVQKPAQAPHSLPGSAQHPRVQGPSKNSSCSMKPTTDKVP